MSKIEAVLFDSDGVLTLPEEMFDAVYCQSHGLSREPFQHFFKEEWRPFVIGQKDLKEHIAQNPALWQWSGTPDELVNYWCKVEDVRNTGLLEIISQLRARGIRCYMATEQEKYRAAYLKNVMFPGLFDGYFVTAELGVTKSDPKFFELVFAQLRLSNSELQPGNVVFFDDSQSKVDAARLAGIDGRLYTGLEQATQLLDQVVAADA